MYVLVIGRESTWRELYVTNLMARGVLAVAARNVRSLQRLIEREPPSLILLCQLAAPQEDELAEIRQFPNLDDAPLIYVTSERPYPAWLEKWKVDLHVQQPVKFEAFFQRIQMWIYGDRTTRKGDRT